MLAIALFAALLALAVGMAFDQIPASPAVDAVGSWFAEYLFTCSLLLAVIAIVGMLAPAVLYYALDALGWLFDYAIANPFA